MSAVFARTGFHFNAGPGSAHAQHEIDGQRFSYGIGDHFRAMRAADLPIIFCSSHNDGVVEEALNSGAHPDDCIIFRLHAFSDRRDDVPQWMGSASSYTETAASYAAWILSAYDSKPIIRNNRDRIIVSLLNEKDQNQFDYINQLGIDVAQILIDEGYSVLAFNHASGTPRVADVLTRPSFRDVLHYAAEQKGRFHIGIHGYSYADDLGEADDSVAFFVDSWRWWERRRLAENIAPVSYISKEFGWRQNWMPTSEAAVTQLDWLMRHSDPTIPRMVWGLGHWHGDLPEKVASFIFYHDQWRLHNQYAPIEDATTLVPTIPASLTDDPAVSIPAEGQPERQPIAVTVPDSPDSIEPSPLTAALFADARQRLGKTTHPHSALMQRAMELAGASFAADSYHPRIYEYIYTDADSEKATIYLPLHKQNSEVDVDLLLIWDDENGRVLELFPPTAALAEPDTTAPIAIPDAPVVTPDTIDLLAYLRPEQPLGTIYEVRRSDGGQERVQTQWDNTHNAIFYHVKGEHQGFYEMFAFDDHFIYRGIDTSENEAGFYIQFEDGITFGGFRFARWCRRFAAVGERPQLFAHHVEHRHKADGLIRHISGTSQLMHGQNTNRILLADHHDSWTSEWGVTVDDVVWLHGLNAEGDITEEYVYARGLGLVAHRHHHHAEFGIQQSELAEIHAPGQRPDITRYRLPVMAQSALGIV